MARRTQRAVQGFVQDGERGVEAGAGTGFKVPLGRGALYAEKLKVFHVAAQQARPQFRTNGVEQGGYPIKRGYKRGYKLNFEIQKSSIHAGFKALYGSENRTMYPDSGAATHSVLVTCVTNRM